MVDVDPPEELPDHWHSEFRSYFVKCYRKKLSQFDFEQYQSRLQTHIQKEKEHRKLLNLCIFPFNGHPSPSNFQFVRADPLEELDVPNFDFLLWDFDGQAIFGEVKANISQGPMSLINEVNDQCEAVEENEEYIIENYLGEEPRNTEYVLATFASDASQITRKVIESGNEIVTWAVHQMEKSISVNEFLPRSEEIPAEEDIDDVRLRIKHSNHELNRTLENADSAEGTFDLFPESDPVAKLRILITAQFSEDGHCFAEHDTIKQILSENLFYIDEADINQLCESIIELGKEIGYLREWEGDEADYKIVSRYTSSDGLEKTLEKKWVEHRIEDKKDKFWDSCVENAIEEVDLQSTISDF